MNTHMTSIVGLYRKTPSFSSCMKAYVWLGILLITGCTNPTSVIVNSVQLPKESRILQKGDHVAFRWGDSVLNCEWKPSAIGLSEDGYCYSEMKLDDPSRVERIPVSEPSVYERTEEIERIREECMAYYSQKKISEEGGPGLTIWEEYTAMFADKCSKLHPLPLLPKL